MTIRPLLVIGIIHGLVLAAFSLPAVAGPRDATLAELEQLERARPGADVRVRVMRSGAEGEPVRIGEELAYRFESDRPGYLVAVHVDTHGATTLLYPRANPEAGRVDAGQPISLPGPEDGFTLQAQPPIGRDVVYAIVTEEPVSRADLGLPRDSLIVSIEPHEAPDFAGRLRRVLEDRARGAIRVAHVVQQIEGREDVLYRSADIVRFFGERTRSIRPPKLDLQIHFGLDSAELDEEARRNVDEFARALEDPKLSGMRFKVAGHTDDTGSAEHNLGLSRRRAEAVRRYLVESGGIEPGRLEIEAHGENNLLMTERSEYARRMNRRVEFAPAR